MSRVSVRIAALVAAVGSALAVSAALAPWLCAWFIFLGTFLAVWRVSWRMAPDPFAPLLAVSGYLFLGMGIRGLAVREGWLSDHYNIPLGDQWLTASVWLLGSLALVSCLLGYRSRRGRQLGEKWGSWRWVESKWTREAIVTFSVLTALVGVLSLLLLRHRFSGVSGFGQTPAAVASQTSEGGLFTIDMLAYFPLIGALLTWRRKGLGVIGRMAMLANLALVVSWFLLAGRKSLLFEMILGLIIVQHYLRRRIRGRVLVIFLIPAIFVVSLSFYFKDYGFKEQSIRAEYSQQPLWEAAVDPLLNRSYQFDATTMILAKTPSGSDYRLGSTFEDLLWFYIPRQWWPDKPVSFGYSFAPQFFPGASLTASYAPSMVGELYLNFGVLGVVGGFYLFGVVLRVCYEAFAGRKTQLAAAVYTILLFRLTNMVEGPITTHIEFLLAELLPVAVLLAADKVLAPARRAVAGDGEARSVSVPLPAVAPLPRVAQER
jgi:oligosaccharide repeat unit polymerase